VRLYFVGEASMFWVRGSAHEEVAGVQIATSASAADFGTTATLGLEIDRVDLRGGFLIADIEHADARAAFVGSVAFQFASL
jgi:hypothetical protein